MFGKLLQISAWSDRRYGADYTLIIALIYWSHSLACRRQCRAPVCRAYTVFGCPEADGHCLLVSATTGSKPMPPAAVSSKPTVLSLAADLAAGRTSSRALIEAALARIADPAGEGARSFVKVHAGGARAAADAQDALRKAGYV